MNTGLFVPLPGATSGEKDLFVQFDYMCSAFAPDGVHATSASRTCTPRPMPRATIRWRWSHRHTSILECISISNPETRFPKTRTRAQIEPGHRIALRVPQHLIGPAAGRCPLEWRCGTLEGLAGQFQCLHVEPIHCKPAHLVSRLARRTAITTFCSVTLLRYRPGIVGLDR